MDMYEQLITYKIPLLIGLVGTSLLFISLIALSKSYDTSQPETLEIIEKQEPIENTTHSAIVIDIQGAVKEPGVYEFEKDMRIGQVIEEIGGFDKDADITWIGKELNQALVISDGMKLYIPFEDENLKEKAHIESATSQIININTSSQSELESLPGIGEVTSNKIIQARPYSSVEDLLDQKIVGQATYDKILDRITTN